MKGLLEKTLEKAMESARRNQNHAKPTKHRKPATRLDRRPHYAFAFYGG